VPSEKKRKGSRQKRRLWEYHIGAGFEEVARESQKGHPGKERGIQNPEGGNDLGGCERGDLQGRWIGE